jgi:adenosylmethionine-8-amino-7-oxononanoate aminotransferase
VLANLLEARGLSRAEAIGARIGRGLEAVAGRPGVREVRGIGPMRAVEIEDAAGRGYLGGAAARMAAAALEHDVLLRPLGPVVYALPPLCVTDAECDRIAAALCAAVRAGTSGA